MSYCQKWMFEFSGKGPFLKGSLVPSSEKLESLKHFTAKNSQVPSAACKLS